VPFCAARQAKKSAAEDAEAGLESRFSKRPESAFADLEKE
jgi:hypothetical protein